MLFGQNKWLRQYVTDRLEPGEVILWASSAQLKVGGGAKRLGKHFAVGMAASLISGGTVVSLVSAPPVFITITNKRLHILQILNARKPAGEVYLDVPLDAVTLTAQPTQRALVNVQDAETGEHVFQITFAFYKKRMSKFLDAFHTAA